MDLLALLIMETLNHIAMIWTNFLLKDIEMLCFVCLWAQMACKKQVYRNAFYTSFSETFPECSAWFPFVEMTF